MFDPASDPAYLVTAVLPLGTATGIWYIKTSGTDTGTKATTSRSIDLSRALHLGATGGKPLDATVHRRYPGPPTFRALTLTAGVKLNFKTGSTGENVYITVAHKTRQATSGAGSTFRTLKTDVFRWKNGTDTAAQFLTGFASSVNFQAGDKLYKANITVAFRKASSTAAKDTTTGAAGFTLFNPTVTLSGGNVPSFVPNKVS